MIIFRFDFHKFFPINNVNPNLWFRCHIGSANAERFFLVRWFYGCYPFFGYLCVGAEFTYIIMYPILVSDMNFHGADMLYFIMYIMLPACLMKQIVNVAQLCSACYAIAEQDAYKKNKSWKVHRFESHVLSQYAILQIKLYKLKYYWFYQSCIFLKIYNSVIIITLPTLSNKFMRELQLAW